MRAVRPSVPGRRPDLNLWGFGDVACRIPVADCDAQPIGCLAPDGSGAQLSRELRSGVNQAAAFSDTWRCTAVIRTESLAGEVGGEMTLRAGRGGTDVGRAVPAGGPTLRRK